MEIDFRPAKESESNNVASLLQQLGYAVEMTGVQLRIDEIRRRGGEVSVVTADSTVVGCIQLRTDIRLAEGMYGEIVSLVIDHNHRNLGLGGGLVSYAQNWFIEKGVSVLRVSANSIREDAHRFYQRHGFKLMKTQNVFRLELKKQI